VEANQFMPKTKTRTTKTKPLYSADAVRTYLHEIGRVPLLTHEEEIVFGKQVQAYMALLETKDTLVESLNREPTIAEWAEAAALPEAELKQKLRQGERAKRKMIEANLRLVVAIAKKISKAQFRIPGFDSGGYPWPGTGRRKV
jgi:RNA polymerase nonessential primary-like sigma factor